MNNNTVHSLDQLLRGRALKELEAETRKRVEDALRPNQGQQSHYREIRLNCSDLKVIDNGQEAEDDGHDRYTVQVSVYALTNVLVADAMSLHGPQAEQAAIKDFLERVESLGDEIDELRQPRQEG